MKIGVMNNPSASVYDEIVSLGKAGYDYVDLTMEGPKAVDIGVTKLQALLDQYELSVVGHTDPCLPYSYPIMEIRKACLKELERCAKTFSSLGAKVMNIHPCYTYPPAMRHDMVDLNIAALKPIADMVGSLGLTLAFENFKAPFDSVSTLNTLIQEVPGLKVNLDFGHANMGNDNGEAFCRALGNNIVHVHFSDNRSTGDHHMPLGVGNVDWRKAVSALKAIGYNKTITLEVFCNDRTVLFQYLEFSRSFVLKLWNQPLK